jgi:hypothetical protein
MNTKTSASIDYRLQVVEGDEVVNEIPFKRNLIIDSGLHRINSQKWTQQIEGVAIGSGSGTTKRDSGSVTFARTGTTITASAGFFVAGDVGRLLRWDTGEEVYITGFVSGTSATCATGPDIAAAQGTVWYVNLTGLVSLVETTNTVNMIGDTGFNGAWFNNGNQVVTKKTFITAARATPVTITEVAWGRYAGGVVTVFGMDFLDVPVSLGIGQSLRVTVQLTLNVSPYDSLIAVPNVGTNFNASGTLSCDRPWSSLGLEYFTSSGAVDNGGFWMRPELNDCRCANAAMTQSPGVNTALDISPYVVNSSKALETYGNNFTRELTCTWVPGALSGKTIYGFYFSFNGCNISYKLTTPQTITADQSLKLRFKWVWGRTLQN